MMSKINMIKNLEKNITNREIYSFRLLFKFHLNFSLFLKFLQIVNNKRNNILRLLIDNLNHHIAENRLHIILYVLHLLAWLLLTASLWAFWSLWHVLVITTLVVRITVHVLVFLLKIIVILNIWILLMIIMCVIKK